MPASTQGVASTRSWQGSGAIPARSRPAWPQLARRDGAAGARATVLTRVVEQDVIPRLILAHGPDLGSPAAPAACPVDPEEVREFGGLVLSRDAAVACSYLEAKRTRGATLEALYLNLLAPAARWLGELWEEDGADFTEVTVGLLRLMHVLHEVGPAFRDEAVGYVHGRRALLAPAPGDQHSFGLAMVSDFFRRGGWAVWNPPAASRGDVARLVRREWFAVAGISVSCERWLDSARAVIRAIRDHSCNRAIAVMVGGPLFLQHPDLAAQVGADATATDGRQAVLQAQGLLTHMAGKDR